MIMSSQESFDAQLNASTAVDLKQTLVQVLAQNGPDDTLAPGTRIGAFQVHALLGQGGMGEVYRVMQLEPVTRPVALKIIRPTLRGGASSSMFEIERQALAALDHPNIAKLYDAGEIPDKTGRTKQLYFAMEWVDGLTLERHVQSQRLQPRFFERVCELMIQVCLGAHHAHQRNLVHRDLKPSNVLVRTVDGVDVPKIIDFGIAVSTSSKQHGAAGTQAYMAPEQMIDCHPLDARADVHALGVCLLELLCSHADAPTEQTDYASTQFRQALSLIGAMVTVSQSSSEQKTTAHRPDLTALVQALKQVPQPLRAIASKAMSEHSNDRYGSAQALAEDLQAFLSFRPVRAMPASTPYIWGLFVRRNRVKVLFSAALLVSLVLGLAAALYGLWQAQAQRALAERQALRAQNTSQFLADILTSVDPDKAQSLDTKLLKSILANAADKASLSLQNDPIAQSEVQGTIAQTYNSLTEYRLAEKSADAAIAAMDRSAPVDVRKRFVLERLRLTARSGWQDPAISLSEMTALCEKANALFGPADELSLRCQSARAWDLYYAGKFAEAHELTTSIQSVLDKGTFPIDMVLYNLRVLGAAQGSVRKLKESEASQRRLVQLSTQEYGPEHSRTIHGRNSLAVSLLQQKRFDEAAKELAELVPLSEKIFGEKHVATVTAYANYAGALRQSGQVEQSGPYYHKAYQLSSEISGVTHSSTLVYGVNLSNYEWQSGQPHAALKRLTEIRPKLVKAFSETHPTNLEWYKSRAEALRAIAAVPSPTQQADRVAAREAWRTLLEWTKANVKNRTDTIADAENALRQLDTPD